MLARNEKRSRSFFNMRIIPRANAIPLTVFIDADGRVLHKTRGAYEWDRPEIIAAIGEVFRIKLKP